MREGRFVRRAVLDKLGSAQDNAHRARSAFKNYTPEQMQEQHGASGRTRADILGDYEEYELECKYALAWFDDMTQGAHK